MICGFRFALSCYFGKTHFCLKGTNIAFSKIKNTCIKSQMRKHICWKKNFFTGKMYYCMWKVCKEVQLKKCIQYLSSSPSLSAISSFISSTSMSNHPWLIINIIRQILGTYKYVKLIVVSKFYGAPKVTSAKKTPGIFMLEWVVE